MITFGDREYIGHVIQEFRVIVHSHQGVDESSLGSRLTREGSLTVQIQEKRRWEAQEPEDDDE